MWTQKHIEKLGLYNVVKFVNVDGLIFTFRQRTNFRANSPIFFRTAFVTDTDVRVLSVRGCRNNRGTTLRIG